MPLRPFQFSPQSSAQTLLATIRQRADGEQFGPAIVLGSGWADAFADGELIGRFRYADWPCFPIGQVKGHPGCLDIVRSGAQTFVVFRGRFHCYQGLSAYETTLPVRLASALGCPSVLLCCATGGINPDYVPGDYMLVNDHLNLLGDNPLRGLNDQVFIDLAALYRVDFYERLSAAVVSAGIRLHSGVLAAMPGPSYETPAEVRMLKILGADVVSMSVVGEAIMARYLGLEVAALALIANRAAGMTTGSISHTDVLACGQTCSSSSTLLLQNLLTLLAGENPSDRGSLESLDR